MSGRTSDFTVNRKTKFKSHQNLTKKELLSLLLSGEHNVFKSKSPRTRNEISNYYTSSEWTKKDKENIDELNLSMILIMHSTSFHHFVNLYLLSLNLSNYINNDIDKLNIEWLINLIIIKSKANFSWRIVKYFKITKYVFYIKILNSQLYKNITNVNYHFYNI